MKTFVSESIKFPQQVVDMFGSKLIDKLGIPVTTADLRMIVDLTETIVNNPKIAKQTADKLKIFANPLSFGVNVNKKAAAASTKIINKMRGVPNDVNGGTDRNKRYYSKIFYNVVRNEINAILKDLKSSAGLALKIDSRMMLNPRFWTCLTKVIATSGTNVAADVGLCMCVGYALRDYLKAQAEKAAKKKTQKPAAEALSPINENTKITLTVSQLRRLVNENRRG